MSDKNNNSKTMKEVIDQFSGWFEDESHLMKLSNTLYEATLAVNEVLNKKEIRTFLNNINENIEDNFDRIEILIQTFEDLFSKAGYPPNNNLELNDITGMIDNFNEGELGVNPQQMNRFMLNLYGKEKLKTSLNRILSLNLNCLKGREILLTQSYNAHNQGLYALTVPALVTQFEGIIISAYGINGKVTGVKFNSLLKNVLSDKEDLGRKERAWEFYKNFIKEGFEHGKVSKSPISRHGIAHGGILPNRFANEESSLKLILTLEFILHQISELKVDDIIKVKEEIGNVS